MKKKIIGIIKNTNHLDLLFILAYLGLVTNPINISSVTPMSINSIKTM